MRLGWRRPKEPTRIVDLRIGELRLPADLTELPERSVDLGVVPEAMRQYLEHAEEFPILPTVRVRDGLFEPVTGGRTLWAAARAGWNRPIRCAIRVGPELPPAVAARTIELVPALRADPVADATPDPTFQVLSFSRPVHDVERRQVELALQTLAETARERDARTFTEVADLAWLDASTFAWRTPMTASPDDPVLVREFRRTLVDLRSAGLPLVAHNGRAVVPLVRGEETR
jgi:hypothetical protein